MTLSICMIARDEEDKIGETLESARFAEEIIVADCGSQDETELLARAFNARVFSCAHQPNLNINKNFTFVQATGDWILCLDADEVIPSETAQQIRNLLQRSPRENAFYLPRRNYYFGRWLKHGGHYPDWQLRLFRRNAARFPTEHIHERLQVDGSIGRLHFPFNHYPYQDQEECRAKLDRDTNFEAQYLYQKGVRPSIFTAFRFMFWKPAQRFLNRYIFKLGFLDGKPGWIAIKMDMQNFCWRYTKLRQLALREPGGQP